MKCVGKKKNNTRSVVFYVKEMFISIMNTYSTLFLNIKSAICIQTTAMYSTKVTAYLNIKRKWLQNCEVTYGDRCHVSVTRAFFKLTDDMSVKSLTAMSPMTSLSLFLPKRCKKMWQHLNTYMIDITVHIFCTASMVFPICQDSQRTLVFHISKSTNEFKVLATPGGWTNLRYRRFVLSST